MIVEFLNKPFFLQWITFYRQNWFADVYIKPWCRIGPYIVGIMVGYLLHITDKQKPKIHKVFLMYLTWLFFSDYRDSFRGVLVRQLFWHIFSKWCIRPHCTGTRSRRWNLTVHSPQTWDPTVHLPDMGPPPDMGLPTLASAHLPYRDPPPPPKKVLKLVH